MFGNFCGDHFWDLNQTWYNDVPDFSQCFQDTVLTALPCILYSFILFISLCLLSKPGSNISLPWTWLNLSKLCFCVSLLIVSCLNCGAILHDKFNGHFVPHSSLLSSFSKVAIFLLITVAMLRHRFCGVISSTALCTFWIVFSVCSTVVYRSAILTYFDMDTKPTSGIIFICSMIFYPIVIIELFLSLFVDRRKFILLQEDRIRDDVSFIAYVSFLWFLKFIYKGRKRLLTISDLSFQTAMLTTKYIYSSFERQWTHYLLPDKGPRRSLLWALIKSCWPCFVGTLVMDVMTLLSVLVPPLLLDRIIDFATDDFYTWRGYMFAGLIFFVDFTGKILQNHLVHLMSMSCIQLQSAVLGALFRKNLQMSSGARKDYPSGNIMSLVTVDVKRIQWFTLQISNLISAPLRIVFIVFVMWQYIGISTLAGVGVIFVLFPISFFVSRVGWKYSDKQMESKDVRLKLMNEILNGIKILKLYAWEKPFAARAAEARKEEVKWIRYSFFCNAVTTLVYFCTPIAVSVASFATYLMVDKNNVLDPTRAFVTLTLMEQLRAALFELPDAIADLIQFNISLKRLRKFFEIDNKDERLVGSNPEKDDALTIRNASFSWTASADCSLKDINLHVQKGKLIAVIGPVGSGKSSLLSAILGELPKSSGTIDIKGTIAYLPQQPWVLNRTLKDNILLVKNMVESKYNKTINICCLKPDLEILPAGDRTEIGEKGVNLSGGQKSRVNLAQAVYQDKDVYLLDDPLSAVDVHVRKALFSDVIGNTGVLKHKTRILVTHDVSILQNVDLIVSMKDGLIDEIGTYDELLKNNGSFTSFVEEHLNVKPTEEGPPNSITRMMSTDSTASRASGAGDQPEKFIDGKEGDHRLMEEEKMEIGSVHWLIYWRYLQTAGLPIFFGVVAMYILYVFADGGANIWLSKWSADAVFNRTESVSKTTWRLSIYGALGFTEAVSVASASFLIVLLVGRASERYHKKMLDSVMKSPMTFFDSTPTGRIINRFTTDLEILDNQLFYRIDAWLNSCLRTMASFTIIGMKTPIFLASLLPLGILYYLIQRLHLNTFRQIKRLESTARSPVYSLFMEAIQGVSSISAYGVKKDFISSFEERVDNYFVCSFNSFVCNRWLTFCLDSMGSVIILVATLLAIQDRNVLDPAVVGLIVSYALSVTDDMKWFVRMNSELEDKSISVERVDEYCRLTPEATWDLSCDGMTDDWPEEGCIFFDDYSTKYRENLDLVLKDVNLCINSSEKVGIIGRTGAGKTSVTLALFRIIEPVSGTIAIDNIDITKIGLHTLRSKLAIIPQDPVLFTGTLRINLDPNNVYSDDEVWSSLEKSHLKPFVANLPEGLEHKIDEGGSNLSAGQRQMVCLARALLKNSKILILDEATASVDMDTDSLIQNTIRTAFADRTVITIAHRLHTVMDYDKIVVMESGEVAEVGNPATLLEDPNSRFFHMIKEAGLR